jgi:hypothetical protein
MTGGSFRSLGTSAKSKRCEAPGLGRIVRRLHRDRPFDENETSDLRRVTTRDVASTRDQVP